VQNLDLPLAQGEAFEGAIDAVYAVKSLLRQVIYLQYLPCQRESKLNEVIDLFRWIYNLREHGCLDLGRRR